MSDWQISVVNNTGKAASDLHITFSGTGGNLFIDPNGVLGGGVVPTVPSNPPAIANEAIIDWGSEVIPSCGTVWFSAKTGAGPLEFISGYWTSKVDGVPDSNIGAVESQDITISRIAQKFVINSAGAVSLFSDERLIRDLLSEKLGRAEALRRAEVVGEAVRTSPSIAVSTRMIRASLRALRHLDGSGEKQRSKSLGTKPQRGVTSKAKSKGNKAAMNPAEDPFLVFAV